MMLYKTSALALAQVKYMLSACVRYFMAQQTLFEYSPSSELMASSPRTLITLFLLGRYNHYLDKMDNPSDINLDTTTAALLSTLPNKIARDVLFDSYKKRKEDPKVENVVTASILTTGDWFAQLSDTLEFTEKSTGGF